MEDVTLMCPCYWDTLLSYYHINPNKCPCSNKYLAPPLPLFRNNVIFLFVSLDDITVQFGSNLKGKNLLLAEQSLSLS